MVVSSRMDNQAASSTITMSRTNSSETSHYTTQSMQSNMSYLTKRNKVRISNRTDEGWRRLGKALRKQLLLQDEAKGGGNIKLSQECSILRYYQVSEKVLDQFISHSVESKEDLIDAYLVGNRLVKFLSRILPTHKDYNTSYPELRTKSYDHFRDIKQYLECMARLIDEQEYQSQIGSILDTSMESAQSQLSNLSNRRKYLELEKSNNSAEVNESLQALLKETPEYVSPSKQAAVITPTTEKYKDADFDLFDQHLTSPEVDRNTRISNGPAPLTQDDDLDSLGFELKLREAPALTDVQIDNTESPIYTQADIVAASPESTKSQAKQSNVPFDETDRSVISRTNSTSQRLNFGEDKPAVTIHVINNDGNQVVRPAALTESPLPTDEQAATLDIPDWNVDWDKSTFDASASLDKTSKDTAAADTLKGWTAWENKSKDPSWIDWSQSEAAATSKYEPSDPVPIKPPAQVVTKPKKLKSKYSDRYSNEVVGGIQKSKYSARYRDGSASGIHKTAVTSTLPSMIEQRFEKTFSLSVDNDDEEEKKVVAYKKDMNRKAKSHYMHSPLLQDEDDDLSALFSKPPSSSISGQKPSGRENKQAKARVAWWKCQKQR